MQYPLYFDLTFVPVCSLLSIKDHNATFKYSIRILGVEKYIVVGYTLANIVDCLDFKIDTTTSITRSINGDILVVNNKMCSLFSATHLGLLLYRRKVQYKTYDKSIPSFSKHTLVGSHLLFLNKELVVFEFELETPSGWNNLTMAFAYDWIIKVFAAIPCIEDYKLDAGMYIAEESRMIDIVSAGTCRKLEEKHMASVIYNIMY